MPLFASRCSLSIYTAFSTYSEATILLLTTVLSAEVCDVCGGAKEILAVPGQSVADRVTDMMPQCSTKHKAPHSHCAEGQQHMELRS